MPSHLARLSSQPGEDHRGTTFNAQIAALWPRRRLKLAQRFLARTFRKKINHPSTGHTHAEEAFHSETDDMYPIIGTAGFISIVVPRYGFELPSIDGLYVTKIKSGGGWQQLRPKEALRVK